MLEKKSWRMGWIFQLVCFMYHFNWLLGLSMYNSNWWKIYIPTGLLDVAFQLARWLVMHTIPIGEKYPLSISHSYK